MQMQTRFNLVMTSGLAMFAMFFGSGNLVFPLAIGAETTSQLFYSILGLALTGVCVPFLGLLAMILFDGNREAAFSYIGRWPAFVLSFAMLSLMGPFGVAARCIIVAYGGVAQIFPDISLDVFGLIWSVITGIIILRKEGWLGLIGQYLTPLLLLSIALIVGAGLWYAPPIEISTLTSSDAFKIGLDQGYQTMDLLAAFFFSVTVVGYLHQHLKHEKLSTVLKLSLSASFVGAGLLLLVYVGFVAIGALYGPELAVIPAEQRLAFVANATLGNAAMFVVAAATALACLTTFVVLIVLFAEFMTNEMTAKRVPYAWSVWVTLGISYGVSMLGFGALAAWIGAALTIAYPALIAFSVGLIVYKVFKVNLIAPAFWIGLLINIVWAWWA